MRAKPRVVVIGAGPAGLGVGWRLTELGHDDFTIYEKQSYVGGLATSFTDQNGFVWDIGGHVLHSHYPYFDTVFREVMHGEYLTHQRNSVVRIGNQFVPYPFQNHIDALPKRIRDECLAGLTQLPDIRPGNFHDWLLSTYGSGMAKYFFFPYNEKVWAYPLKSMSYQWVADRIAPALSRSTSWGPNAVFQYPATGGTGEIWRRVAGRFPSHIRLSKEVVRIDTHKKIIYFSDNTHDAYDVLFSSMPLDQIADAPALVHSSVTVVGIGIQGTVPENLATTCWMYFPDHTLPFFRATVLSNYSPHNAPGGTWSLMFEVSSSRYRHVSKGDILVSVRDAATTSGLLPRGSKLASTWTYHTEYGYPTPTIGRDAVVDPLLRHMEARNIFSRGRFGAWKYEVSNQDHTFMQGVEWVNRILEGARETTLIHI